VALQTDLTDYVATQIATAMLTSLKNKGGLDCHLNPNYPSATTNDMYFVTVAGKLGGASGPAVEVGDTAICISTAVAGDQATVGSHWIILQVNIPGLTTVGLALATLANPGVISFLRVNADSTVTALTPAQTVTALGKGGTPIEIQLAASDETTAIAAGTGKITFRMPCAMTVTGVRASLTTAQASGNIFKVDINEAGTSILSTKLTIDNTAKTSVGAAAPAVISDANLADDAEMTVDVDQIGNGTATGIKVTLIGTRA